MKKTFKMANAELNKIFLRPSMFVLFTVLVIALVFSFFMFKPAPSSKKFTYDGINTAEIYLQKFEKDRTSFKKQLFDAKESVTLYLTSTSEGVQVDDKLADLKKAFNETFESDQKKSQFYILYDAVINLDKNYLKPSPVELKKVTDELERFSKKLFFDSTNPQEQGIYHKLLAIKNQEINFYIKTDELTDLTKTIYNLYQNLPTTQQLEKLNRDQIIKRFNLIVESYNIKELNIKVQNLKKIEIDPILLTNLLDEYYYNNIEENLSNANEPYIEKGKLAVLYANIKDYYNLNPTSADKAIVKELNERIAKYYDYIQINKALIENKFELLRIGSKSDDEIVNYNGFSGTSVYNLKKEIATYEYFLKINTFGYEYLTAFNFNSNSGVETNAFDFSFYAMQILSSLIVLFVIFFACGAISGEQNAGTLKMTAIRPFTRNKIYSGKFLACFNVGLILMTISLIASLTVGAATFGFTSQKVLMVANASKVFVASPFVVTIIHFASLLVDIVFYLALALLVSMIIKPTTISTAVTSSIFLASTIISGTVTSSWIRFIPSLNVGIYKFFTKSSTGIFSYSIVPSLNMVQSLIIVVASVLIFDILARIIFKSKSIDK